MMDKNIPEGYKQTELGLIPEDWEVRNILELYTLKARIGWQGLTTSEYLNDGDYFLITGTDFIKGRIGWESCHFVDYTRYAQDSNIQIKKRDILITKDGTIGKIAYVSEIPKPATLNSGIFVVRLKNEKTSPEYFYHVLNSRYFSSFLNTLKAGSTISHLYQKDFVDFVAPFPCRQEQDAIATALSDVDNLITSLEQLIDKKKAIKQGAIQELLTGRRRIAGFGEGKGYKQTEVGLIPEDWEVHELGECLSESPKYGINAAASPLNPDLPTYLRITDISENGKFLREGRMSVDHPLSNSYFLREGDIVFARTGASVGKTYLYNSLDGNLVFAGFLILIKSDADILLPLYLKYLTQTKQYWDWVGVTSVRTGQPGINGLEYKQLIIPIPSVQEQQAIATALSSMDEEIESIEKKLAKYQKVKEGMMQNLLTGKIRLVG